MHFDWAELRDLQAQKLLYIVPHESGKQWILNYAPHAQYEKAWDAHPVLLDCRGTIIDADGRAIAKPFRKFFNVGERPDTAIDVLATLGEPEIAHKLDGSMVTLWRDDAGGVNFATRGSFTSPQAHMAAAIWRERHAYAERNLHPNLTYIFELVGPDNRIVVHYPDNALILTGAVWTLSGEECAYAGVTSEATRLRLPVVETESADWGTLSTLARGNFEGFVLFWYGHQGERRVKVKLAEYVRLHRIITGLSEHTIWEILSTGGDTETLRREIPEEMYGWFDGVTRDLHAKMATHRRAVEAVYEHLHDIGLTVRDREARKRVAAYILDKYPDLKQPLFRALDDKEYQSIVWKWVEPSGVPVFKDADA